jgi:DNA-binding LacI/PurR family transcriptional regulator
LTTVFQPCIEIGRQLAKMAIEKSKAPSTPISETIVRTELVLRGTTWPLVEARAGGRIAAAPKV